MDKRKSLIIISIAIGLVLIAFIISYLNTTPTIIKSLPNNNSTEFDTYQSIEITLSAPISKKQLKSIEVKSSTINPKFSTTIEGKEIKILTERGYPLVPNNDYSINLTLSNRMGTNNRTETINFKTKALAEGQIIPKELEDALIANTDSLEDGKDPNHKLVKYLPYENSFFAIDYEPQRNGIDVIYLVVIKGADQNRSKDLLYDWIKDKGVDYKTLDLQFNLE